MPEWRAVSSRGVRYWHLSTRSCSYCTVCLDHDILLWLHVAKGGLQYDSPWRLGSINQLQYGAPAFRTDPQRLPAPTPTWLP